LELRIPQQFRLNTWLLLVVVLAVDGTVAVEVVLVDIALLCQENHLVVVHLLNPLYN